MPQELIKFSSCERCLFVSTWKDVSKTWWSLENPNGLFLYFGPQYVVKITEQRAVEHVDQEGKFQQEPVNKLGGRAVLFLSDSGRLLRSISSWGRMLPMIKHLVETAEWWISPISKLSTSLWKINHSILRLADHEYRFIYFRENRSSFRLNAAFEAQNFRRVSERRVTNLKTLIR